MLQPPPTRKSWSNFFFFFFISRGYTEGERERLSPCFVIWFIFPLSLGGTSCLSAFVGWRNPRRQRCQGSGLCSIKDITSPQLEKEKEKRGKNQQKQNGNGLDWIMSTGLVYYKTRRLDPKEGGGGEDIWHSYILLRHLFIIDFDIHSFFFPRLLLLLYVGWNQSRHFPFFLSFFFFFSF
jgi:hypothetical protein